MGSSVFRFKKFTIHQDLCAMKVGTDSVILGSWANTNQAKNCLDIGTGTGLLSLMMAQKGIEKITAIDIDESACLQATLNVQNSIFKNHIEIINQSFQDFCKGHPKKYDHIISNPPFFKNSLRPNEHKKSFAKHQDALNFRELINGVSVLLEKGGNFYFIIPNDSLEEIEQIALENKIFFHSKLFVYPNKNSINPKRVCVGSCNIKKTLTQQNLTIENSVRHDYSDDYKNLTSSFYLAI